MRLYVVMGAATIILSSSCLAQDTEPESVGRIEEGSEAGCLESLGLCAINVGKDLSSLKKDCPACAANVKSPACISCLVKIGIDAAVCMGVDCYPDECKPDAVCRDDINGGKFNCGNWQDPCGIASLQACGICGPFATCSRVDTGPGYCYDPCQNIPDGSCGWVNGMLCDRCYSGSTCNQYTSQCEWPQPCSDPSPGPECGLWTDACGKLRDNGNNCASMHGSNAWYCAGNKCECNDSPVFVGCAWGTVDACGEYHPPIPCPFGTLCDASLDSCVLEGCGDYPNCGSNDDCGIFDYCDFYLGDCGICKYAY